MMSSSRPKSWVAWPTSRTARASRANMSWRKPRGLAGIDGMRPLAKMRDCSVARIALAWLLPRPHVTSVIIGAKTEEQLADNLAAAEVKLTADELAALDKVSALPGEYPGWM